MSVTINAARGVGRIAIERFFTKDEHDPYVGVEFEKRTAKIANPDGSVVFQMDNVEIPKSWSKVAGDIIVSKYFRKGGVPAASGSETSAKQVVDRIALSIGRHGLAQGYFASSGDATAFADELRFMLIRQYAAFNSPVWFNVGLHDAYGIKGDPAGNWAVDLATSVASETPDGFSRPQASACFIRTVKDDLTQIGLGIAEEMRIFKYGSGAGANFSTLRAKNEKLSGGGTSSGVMSFLKVYDVAAGSVKSGGTCLAPYQRVYTERGAVPVAELAASGQDFIVLSYDPPAGRYKAKTARAWKAGNKRVVRITTDKGEFDLTFDHPVKLSSEETVLAGDLKPGMSLFACTVDAPQKNGGYLRVGLRDGMKGRMRFNRMIAQDVMGLDIEGYSIHHENENKLDNRPANLVRKTQSDHARDHGKDLGAKGEHVFQTQSFPHDGQNNGMHADANFWQDEERVTAYRVKQGEILTSSGRAATMQHGASTQKMLNLGYRLINAGHDISTFDLYWRARKAVVGPIGTPKAELLAAFETRFGCYDGFVKELLGNNHRVISVHDVGTMDVYDVEVDCPTADDKSAESGHNFVIWPTAEAVGSGVVVFNTRRAAKLVCLDADHPDVEEFVSWKAHEERKAIALAQALNLPLDFNGEAYATVSGQNANNSVRVTDEFMQAYTVDTDWHLKWRTTGKVAKTIKARSLMRKIAEAAHACADPGMMYDTTINEWNTVPNFARIEAANPCNEYHFVNDSACNLASINLVRFLRTDGTFDIAAFKSACRTFIVAMDILVDMASYPTKNFAENSHRLRPLGLGYANLGALLMRLGVPYDSPVGQATCASITSLMAATAWRTSAEIAETKGAFAEFDRNREPMLKVARMHADANKGWQHIEFSTPISEYAKAGWQEAITAGERSGFRNAQLTLLAPTGTIGLLMDCDTTGIEPDYALVKHKALAGGGAMKIANQSISSALAHLGYTSAEAIKIVAYVETNGMIEGAPGLREEHLPVFDCATKCGTGTRFIAPRAHIKMMAAAQPFLCGAISKTVNVPTETTIEEIEDIYTEGWRLGLKAIAIYRDGSKGCQVLNSAKKASKKEAEVQAKEPTLAVVPARKRLPKRRRGITQEATVGGHKVYLRTGDYEDGTLGEIFIDMHKEGATMRSLLNIIAISTSLGLQYGVPLDEYVNTFTFTKFEPAGPVRHDDRIKNATSVIDYIFRHLAVNYLNRDDLAHTQKETKTEKGAEPTVAKTYQLSGADGNGNGNGNGHVNGKTSPSVLDLTTNEHVRAELAKLLAEKPNAQLSITSSEPCSNCGNVTIRSGTCSVCITCATTTGCG